MEKKETYVLIKAGIIAIACLLNFLIVTTTFEEVVIDKILFIIGPIGFFVACFMSCHGSLNQFMSDQLDFVKNRDLWSENPFKFIQDPVPHWHFAGWSSVFSGLSGVFAANLIGEHDSNFFLLEAVIGASVIIAQHFSVKLYVWQAATINKKKL